MNAFFKKTHDFLSMPLEYKALLKGVFIVLLFEFLAIFFVIVPFALIMLFSVFATNVMPVSNVEQFVEQIGLHAEQHPALFLSNIIVAYGYFRVARFFKKNQLMYLSIIVLFVTMWNISEISFIDEYRLDNLLFVLKSAMLMIAGYAAHLLIYRK